MAPASPAILALLAECAKVLSGFYLGDIIGHGKLRVTVRTLAESPRRLLPSPSVVLKVGKAERKTTHAPQGVKCPGRYTAVCWLHGTCTHARMHATCSSPSAACLP